MRVKGTVVFHHGNAGSVGYHLPFVVWMVRGGYQVLMYDYRGYGKSGGKISRKGVIEDTRAAIAYAQSRKDVDGKKIISFGHSLGGAKSLAGLGEKMIPGVKGVICFAGFASYQDMARRFAGEAGKEVVTDDHSPRDVVEKIAPVPLLIVHGRSDRTVPPEQGEIDIQVKARKDLPIIFDLKAGERLQWTLQLEKYDVRSRVVFKYDAPPEGVMGDAKLGKGIAAGEVDMSDGSFVTGNPKDPELGGKTEFGYTADRGGGCLHLTLDNSYSKMRAKRVRLSVRLTGADGQSIECNVIHSGGTRYTFVAERPAA